MKVHSYARIPYAGWSLKKKNPAIRGIFPPQFAYLQGILARPWINYFIPIRRKPKGLDLALNTK